MSLGLHNCGKCKCETHKTGWNCQMEAEAGIHRQNSSFQKLPSCSASLLTDWVRPQQTTCFTPSQLMGEACPTQPHRDWRARVSNMTLQPSQVDTQKYHKGLHCSPNT